MNLADLSTLVGRTLRAVSKMETKVLAHLLVTMEQDGKLCALDCSGAPLSYRGTGWPTWRPGLVNDKVRSQFSVLEDGSGAVAPSRLLGADIRRILPIRL